VNIQSQQTKELIMTMDIRWRILALQVVAIAVLAFAAGVGYWAYNFTHDQVSQQLTEQQITFPPANSAAIKALPAANAAEMAQYAGQQMTTGDQAKTYAQNFIAVHLKEIGQGKTYSYWSGIAIDPATPKATAAKADALALTLFRGETLRSLLLNGWAFWFAGTLALYGALGLTVGSVLVFFAFFFELLIVPRRVQVKKPNTGTQSSPMPVA
jgi:hypothetical protein